MAKRLTDSKKWQHPWFTDLSIHQKMTWMFLLDECDHAGIWICSYKYSSYFLGIDFTEKDLKEWFPGKLFWIDKHRLFIPNFIEFQYGINLSTTNNVHVSVIKSLVKHNIKLEDYFPELGEGATQGLRRGLAGAKDKDKDKEKVKVKIKDKEKEKENEILEIRDKISRSLLESEEAPF